MSEPSSPPAPRLAAVKLGYLILFALMGVAWIIYLAGVAASQQACVDSFSPTVANPAIVVGRRLLSGQGEVGAAEEGGLLGARRVLLASASSTCSNNYSFAWWTVWFEFLIIAAAIASALLNGLHQNVVIIFFAIESAILMVVASQVNSYIFDNKDINNSKIEDLVAANRAAMAGIVMLLVFNLLWLIGATESTGTLAPVLGNVALPSLPKLGAAKAAGEAAAPAAAPAPATPQAEAPAQPTDASAVPHAAVDVPADADGTPKKP